MKKYKLMLKYRNIINSYFSNDRYKTYSYIATVIIYTIPIKFIFNISTNSKIFHRYLVFEKFRTKIFKVIGR